MSKEVNYQNWKEFGLNNIQTYMLIDINDILVHYGDATHGMVATSKHLREGIYSRTPNRPLDVVWLMEENKFLLADGCHRYGQAVIEGKKKLLCRVDWKGFSLTIKIPEVNERFNIKEHKNKIFGKS